MRFLQGTSYYRCRARDFNYTCEQKAVRVEIIDEQVVTVLMNLKPPKNWRKGITSAMSEMLGEKNLEERTQEIKDVIERMDKRWDHGFITNEDEFMQQRIKLQMELEQLKPVPDDELEQAADLLKNFQQHWERLEGDEESRHELVKLIVERVYVHDEKVVAMTLRSNYHLVLNHKTNEPTEFTVDSSFVTSGSDGCGALTCKKLVVIFLPKYVVKQSRVTAIPSLINVQLDKSGHLSI